MNYVFVLLLTVFLMGCGDPISFMVGDDNSPEWVTELASTVGEGANAEEGKVGKGKWKEPVTRGTVEDMVVPMEEPAPPEEKPEWVTELEEEVTVVTVGKSSSSGDSIQLDMVGDGSSGGQTVFPSASGPVTGKVDIIFVVDSSNSMNTYLENVRESFAGFIPALSGLDWQMMFTTADHSTSSLFSQNGRAITLESKGKLLVEQKYLTPETKNYQSVFLDTLGVHDALGYNSAGPNNTSQPRHCSLSPGCQDWNEEPLKALKASFSNNRSFFRSGADVAVILFSDSDEGEETPPEDRVRTQDVIDAFQSEWGGENKRLVVYGIIINPNKDDACRAKYSSGFWSGEGIFGVELARMVQATGGASMSLCDQNYAPLAGRIATDFSDR